MDLTTAEGAVLPELVAEGLQCPPLSGQVEIAHAKLDHRPPFGVVEKMQGYLASAHAHPARQDHRRVICPAWCRRAYAGTEFDVPSPSVSNT